MPSQNSTADHPRWRDSRWRDDREWPHLMEAGGMCEDTGAWVTENGECPVHHGDACLHRSDMLTAALRELETERLQMLGKLKQATDALERAVAALDNPTVPLAAWEDARAVLADLRPEEER